MLGQCENMATLDQPETMFEFQEHRNDWWEFPVFIQT